jgi:hypothetical protein
MMPARTAPVLLAALAAAVLSLPLLAHAHSTGAFWGMQDGAYTLDVGYEPATFVEGRYARFDFLLWKGPADTGTAEGFTQVWIRIMDADKQTLMAGGIWKQPYGPTTLVFTFPKPGQYTLEASYRDADGDDIAVATFPIMVEADGHAGIPLGSVGFFIAGLAAGSLALFIAGKRKQRTSV